MSPRPRVLLADDDPDIRLALSDYLTQEGYDVEVVETGNETLLKGTTRSYDVVLLDVGLPDRDGIEVLRELAEHKPHLPIVLLTAFTSLRKTTHPDTLNKAFAYLTKPYVREEVKEVLKRSIIHPRGTSTGTPVGEKTPPGAVESGHPFPAILQPSQSEEGRRSGPHYQLPLDEYQKLAKYVQLMQFAFDRVTDAILIADTNKRFQYANQAACHSLGYTKEELESLRIPDIAPHHDNQRYQDHLKELRQGKSLSYFTTHRTKQGEDIQLEIAVYLLDFHGQEYTCAITKPFQKTNEIEAQQG